MIYFKHDIWINFFLQQWNKQFFDAFTQNWKSIYPTFPMISSIRFNSLKDGHKYLSRFLGHGHFVHTNIWRLIERAFYYTFILFKPALSEYLSKWLKLLLTSTLWLNMDENLGRIAKFLFGRYQMLRNSLLMYFCLRFVPVRLNSTTSNGWRWKNDSTLGFVHFII